MPTRYAFPPQHRQWRNNTRKKGCLEVEMIWDSEAVPVLEKRPAGSPIGSPVSVQDDVYFPEIKPLVLPSSWTVIGKNGKPLKGKTYDEPQTKKKKSKKKTSKVTIDNEPLADLAEMPSSSKTLRACDVADAKRFKEVTRAREAKHWANYRDTKAVKKEAHATLNAMFAIADHARARVGGDEGRLGRRLEKMQEQMIDTALERVTAQHKERRKSLKGDSKKVRTRRDARSAAAVARCFALEDNEYAQILINPLALLAKQKMATEEKALTPSSRAMAVGKVKDDTPAASKHKVRDSPRRRGSNNVVDAQAKADKKKQCRMM